MIINSCLFSACILKDNKKIIRKSMVGDGFNRKRRSLVTVEYSKCASIWKTVRVDS
jgi:hypothetical protein